MSKAIITEQHLHDIANAIIAKGGATEPMTPAQMPAAIAAIPSGGEQYDEDWIIPSGWNDIKKIADAVETPAGMTGRVTFICATDGEDVSWNFYNVKKIYFSDGTLESTGSLVHNWDVSKDYEDHKSGGYKIRFFILFTDEDLIYSNFRFSVDEHMMPLWIVATGVKFGIGNDTFWGSTFLECVDADLVVKPNSGSEYTFMASGIKVIKGSIDFSTATSTYRTFSECDRLMRLPQDCRLNTSLSIRTIFYNCRSLWENPIKDFSQVPDGFSFQSCESMKKVANEIRLSSISGDSGQMFRNMNCEKLADVIDLGSATSINRYAFYGSSFRFFCDEFYATNLTSSIVASTFNEMSKLLSVPRVFNVNQSFSMTQTSYVQKYKDNFAKFDAGGNLIDGMAYNMNDVTGLGLTATISATIKGFFTATEQAAIEAAFNAKGWTLAW